MKQNQPKPDDRSDNVEKLQDMVQNTIENIEEAEETLQNGDVSGEERQQIESKNQRREESLDAMRSEIQDEADDRKNGYQQ